MNAFKEALRLTGVGRMAETTVGVGHDLVRHTKKMCAGDEEYLGSMEWCQWCGTHNPNLTEECPAMVAVRKALGIVRDGNRRSPARRGSKGDRR